MRTLDAWLSSEADELAEVLRTWKDKGVIRPGCAGRTPIVSGGGGVAASRVLGVGMFFAQSCDEPTRFDVGTAEPLPITGIHFCACRALEPMRSCSSPEVSVFADRVEVRRVSRLIGDETCSIGAKVMQRAPLYASGGKRAHPTTPSVEETLEGASFSDALRWLERPHGDLPDCGTAFVSFAGDPSWQSVRGAMAELQQARGDHVVAYVE